jgi:hypothetical protein
MELSRRAFVATAAMLPLAAIQRPKITMVNYGRRVVACDRMCDDRSPVTIDGYYCGFRMFADGRMLVDCTIQDGETIGKLQGRASGVHSGNCDFILSHDLPPLVVYPNALGKYDCDNHYGHRIESIIYVPKSLGVPA